MRRLVAIILGVLAWLPAGVRAEPTRAAADPSIVVGIVATLSGPGALAGQDVLDGFQLALRQLGGRFANQEVRVVSADDKGSPDVARQVIDRLIGRDRLDFMLTAVGPSSLLAIARQITAQRIFMINLDNAPSVLAGPECSPWMFDLAGLSDGAHEAMGQFLAAEHVRRVVVVGPETPLTADAVAALKRTFPGEVTATITPERGSATFEPELRRIEELKPDAVYTLLTGGMGGAFVRAFEQEGLRGEIPLYGYWRGFERPLLPAMGEAGLDVPTTAPWSPDLDTPSNRRLVSDFEVEYGRPATIWAAQGYDAALLLESAIRATNGKTGDSDAVRNALRRADFVSTRGVLRFNTNQFPVLGYYLRKPARDAKGRLTFENKGLVLKDWRDRQAPSCPLRWTEEPAPVKKTTP